MSRTSKKLYVGNLPPDVLVRDVEDIFYRFGKIANCDLRTGKGPPFAFIEFEDSYDAEDAIRARDGYDYDGYKLRVEYSKGDGPRAPRSYPSNNGGRFEPPVFRSSTSGYKVRVSNLPHTGSWQDLKDHFRVAGSVLYTNIIESCVGVVEFSTRDSMKYALRKLDDTKFRSHLGDTAYIRVDEMPSQRNRSVSRSRSRSPYVSRYRDSRSRSRSTSRDRRYR